MGLTKAQRHNRMMDKVFDGYREQLVAMSIRQLIAANQLEDYSRFVRANPHMTVQDSLEIFVKLQDLPL